MCEGYATGSTLGMATDHQLAVYVALDAGSLADAVPLVRQLHPENPDPDLLGMTTGARATPARWRCATPGARPR